MLKLNTRGFAHWIIPVFVVLVIGGIGSYVYLHKSSAVTTDLSASACNLRGRPWYNGTCKGSCFSDAGSYVNSRGTYNYCSKAVSTTISSTKCTSLQRKHVQEGCARRWEQTRLKGANQCLSSSQTYIVAATDYCTGGSAPKAPAPSSGSTGWVWPISNGSYRGLSECWNHPYQGGHHAGQDIVASSGTSVYAAHSGTVVYYSTRTNDGGNTLLVNAGGGLWYSYEHLSSSYVQGGASVQAGQLVARSGNTGTNTTGAHLHFGIAVSQTTGSYADNSATRDPLHYLPHDRSEGSCN